MYLISCCFGIVVDIVAVLTVANQYNLLIKIKITLWLKHRVTVLCVYNFKLVSTNGFIAANVRPIYL